MLVERPRLIRVSDVASRPRIFQTWERHRHSKYRFIFEWAAEALGVFFYTYLGVGSTASLIIGNLTNQAYLGSLFQVGVAYACGIIFAITVCASTSGGHFNPCVTLVYATFRGFPWRKVPGFIISQILGAYIAALIVYLQWKDNITAVEEALAAAGKLNAINFTPAGPAGIFGLYTLHGVNLGHVLANEFFVDVFLGLVIWACIDPSNFFCPPAVAPYSIGLAYAAAIWGFAPNGLAANTARDVGGRLAAMTIWGTRASGGAYAALAALTNILAMYVAVIIYELMLSDSERIVPPAKLDHIEAHAALHMDSCTDNALDDSAEGIRARRGQGSQWSSQEEKLENDHGKQTA